VIHLYEVWVKEALKVYIYHNLSTMEKMLANERNLIAHY